MRANRSLVAAALLLSAGLLQPASGDPGDPGTLDRSFGGDGKVSTRFQEEGSDEAATAVDAVGYRGGKVVTLVDVYQDGGSGTIPAHFGLARQRRNGKLDETFSSDGIKVLRIWEAPRTVERYGRWKILVGGTSGTIARLRANGRLDKSFDFDGLSRAAFDLTISDIVVLNDGKILVAAHSSTWAQLARFNGDGSVDETFGESGLVQTELFNDSGRIRDVQLRSDGKLVAAGYHYEGDDRAIALARYNEDGSLDDTFGNGGRVETDIREGERTDPTEVISQPNGKVVVGGSSRRCPECVKHWILTRFRANGVPDQDFTGMDGSAKGPAAGVESLAFGHDGKIIAAGWSQKKGRLRKIRVDRYTRAGELDRSFSDTGTVLTVLAKRPYEVARVMTAPRRRVTVVADRPLQDDRTLGFRSIRYHY